MVALVDGLGFAGKGNKEPRREDRQRYQARYAQTLFIRREDQDRVGWPAR